MILKICLMRRNEMFHIIFINEASIETENINTVPREYTSEKDIKETKEKEKTKYRCDHQQ
jgi:hypothetical protein